MVYSATWARGSAWNDVNATIATGASTSHITTSRVAHDRMDRSLNRGAMVSHDHGLTPMALSGGISIAG